MSKRFTLSPVLAIDGYKAGHRQQYPDGTEYVYSNFTPRKSRISDTDKVVVFGLQYFLEEYLCRRFNEDFFAMPIGPVIDDYRLTMDEYLGPGAVPVDHIEELHSLGYLPLRIKALAEGTLCPIKVPMLTIVNTLPQFFWLTNQLETIMSSILWPGCTSATTAYKYRKQFDRVNAACGIPAGFTKFQGHDFSFRGMMALEAALLSGAGHLTSFAGTDTIPAIKFIQEYYPGDNGLIGCSVPATEHSVMCMGGQDAEISTYRRLINEIYPKGIVSIVSDTWDFWSIVTTGVTALKDDIMRRDGKVVIRPDSGDPVKVICGDLSAPEGSPEFKGAYRCLYEVFGGDTIQTDYGPLKRLDPHIGLIYGDSITRERQVQIQSQLIGRGFCPDVILGIGSFTYQFVTRDTFGFAMKATWGQVNGEPREIFKDPKTDRGAEKKSAKGLVQVYHKTGRFSDDPVEICMVDQCTPEQEGEGLLRPVFIDGVMHNRTSLAEIRQNLHGDTF